MSDLQPPLHPLLLTKVAGHRVRTSDSRRELASGGPESLTARGPATLGEL